MPRGKRNIAAPAGSAAAIAIANGHSRLTTQQLADLWNMNAGTLRNWRSARPQRGPRFIRVGGSVRYRVGDVADFERRGNSR